MATAPSRIADPPAADRSAGWAVLRLIRPRHWVKNSLVLAALIFAESWGDPGNWLRAGAAFLAFSLLASAIYAINDVLDADFDRAHPSKQHRPVAAGIIPPGGALAVAGVCLVGGLGLSLWLGTVPAVMGGVYVGTMILYSLWLKHVMLLDVLIIAGGLTLRAMYGAAAIHVMISHWLVICAFLIALTLALVKRRQELARLGGDASRSSRRSLRNAPPLATWDQWITAVAGITVLAYVLYTVDPRTVEHVGSSNLLYTTPFVIYALFRYLGQIQTHDAGEDPVDALLTDRGMVVTVLGWLAAVLLVLTGVLG